MEIKYNPTELPALLAEMASYATECIANGNDCKDYFAELAQTGLFHDAIGKVIDNDGNEIVVTTDY